MKSLTAVAVVAYNRPDFFRPTVQSILMNAEVAHNDLWCFLDGGPESCQLENRLILEEELARAPFRPKSVEIIERPSQLGCGRNLIDVRRQLFDEEGYQRAFIFEDDLIVGPHYLVVCERLLDWAQEHFDDIGVVQAYNPCWFPLDEKVCRLDEVEVGNPHWWGYLMPQRTWLAIRETLYEYEQRFLQVNDYDQRNSGAISKWAREKIARRYASAGGADYLFGGGRAFPQTWAYQRFFDGPFCTGQDSMTVLAMTLAGLQKLVTTVNRARPIGSSGLHFCVEWFVRLGLNRIELDNFDSDTSRRVFRARSHDRRLFVSMRQANEIEAIRRVIRERRPRRVLALAAGGSMVLLAREEGIQDWWSVESSLDRIDSMLTALADFPDLPARIVHCPLDQIIDRLNELLPLGFDLIVVDGFDRAGMLSRLRSHLETANGAILLLNASREVFQHEIQRFPVQRLLTEGDHRHQHLMLLQARS